MVCDAVAAGVVPGAEREKVRSLLGAPEDGPAGEDDSQHVDIYDLGVDIGLDTHLLSITYDSEDVVSEVRITHDWGSLVLQPRSAGDCAGAWSFQRVN